MPSRIPETSKLEPWRLRELALLTDDLVLILRSGKNPEWANVFRHFGQELESLGHGNSFDGDGLSRLLRNIRCCLGEEGGLARLELVGGSDEESSELTRSFRRLKIRLKNALDTMQQRLAEYVN
jgi:hypothetical protein